jgi:uncharacterized protein YbjT (DUF2867 family)
MSSVLVTGGAGTLGRELVAILADGGHDVRVMSRRQRSGGERRQPVVADLATGAGVTDAVRGADVVVHCATSPFRRVQEVDVEGTRRLVGAARVAGATHLVYVSIVGIDRQPLGKLNYYGVKLACERIVEESGLPFTILRATQFHDLIHLMLKPLSKLPVVPVSRGFQFQPVHAPEVAIRLAELVARGPSGRVADMGGPQVRRLDDLARAYLHAIGKHRAVVEVPVPAPFARGFREAQNCCPDHADGTVTWEQYLHHRLA